MRFRILLYLLFLTSTAFGQYQAFFLSTLKGNPCAGLGGLVNAELIYEDQVDRGGGVCQSVIREGISYEGRFTPPTGWTISEWKIVRMTHSKTVAARGTGNTVTWTPDYKRIDSCNVYDLVAKFTNGETEDEWISPGEFWVFPVKPTSFTATWNSSQQIDFAWSDHKGDAYKITGNIGTRFGLWNLQSSDPASPVHIVAEGATITSSSFHTLEVGPWKNVILDGCTGSDYGLTLVKSSGGTQGQFFFNTNNTSSTNISSGVWVAGVHAYSSVINDKNTSVAAFRTNTAKNSTNHEGTYAMRDYILAETKVTNAGVEAHYHGQSNDNFESSRRYPRFEGMMFFNNIVVNSGNDGYQMQQQFFRDRNGNGYYDPDVDDPAYFFKNQVYNAGVHNTYEHYNAFQFTPAHVGSVAFMNYAETTHNTLFLNNGTHGMDFEYFSNVTYSTGRDASNGINFFISLTNGDSTKAYSLFKNNTAVVSSGDIFTLFHGATTTTYDKLYSKYNAFVNNTGDDWELGGSGWNTSTEIDFNNRTVTNIATLEFENAASKNYRPATDDSPLWGNYGTVTAKSRYAQYDFDGYKFRSGKPIAGAFSGVPLLISQTLSATGDMVLYATDPEEMIVSQGTSWPIPGLPTEVDVYLRCSKETISAYVTWEQGDYDDETPGTYTVSGTLDLPDWVTNPHNIIASLDITVEEEEILDITGVTNPSGISVAYGTAWPPSSLPATVTVTLEDESTASVSVSWAQGSYDGDVADTYTLTGTLTDLPSNITNSTSKTASISVTVEEEEPEAEFLFGLNLNGSSSPTGFVHTGSVSTLSAPSIGQGNTKDYGEVDSETGISLRGTNPSSSNKWTGGITNGATGGNTLFPSPVCETGWYVQGTDTGTLELYDVPAGSYTIDIIGSRGSIGGPRTTQYRVNGGSWQSLNAANNNSNYVTFTGVTPSTGVITIEIQNTAPSDSQFGYINGIRISQEP